LETFINRDQFRQLAEPTVLANGSVPDLKLDHPRLLAVKLAPVRFAHLATENPLHRGDSSARD